MNERPNAPEACDLETGVCGPVTADADDGVIASTDRAHVLYFTDPICSHCWAMEPAWRRLLFHYGSRIRATHVYGGLLPAWTGFTDRAAGIGAPTDVAPHWAEVAERYGQPIDPGVWLTDPLSSSFPPSIAVCVVRLIDPEREDRFLRRIREAVFLEARNICRVDVLAACATDVGIDPQQFTRLFESGAGEPAFERDRASLKDHGVRGFPTIVVSGPGEGGRLRGTQVFETLEDAVLRAAGLPSSTLRPSASDALDAYGTGTLREFAELLQMDDDETTAALESLGAGQIRPWLWGRR
ncbi:MAG: hypothetical protein ABS36_18625 [Acidobacteria bacterium SCN 69-37]|nr:MAG: hypothetical protein ABS36_18625 [Acidobacteria bacterium SCN 69-37]